MKLEISLDGNDTCDLVDTVFVALLKRLRHDTVVGLDLLDHPEDVKASKKLIKACDVLLKYHVYGYGEES